MPMLSRRAVGVVLAHGRVHVCLRRGPDRWEAASEPLKTSTTSGRIQALRTACRKLGAGRAAAATVLPDSRLQRHRLELPELRSRTEYQAVLRLHLRRCLPPPASAWRYIVEADAGSRHPRVIALHQQDLDQAQALLKGAGLRPRGLLPARSAARTARRTRPPCGSAGQAVQPADRLAAALADRARHRPPDNLLRSEPLAPGQGSAIDPRRTLAATASAAALVALSGYHLDLWPPTSDTQTPPPRPDPPPPAPAPSAVESAPSTQDAPAALPANARRRAAPGWLDALASTRPPRARLLEVELGERIEITAVTANHAVADGWLGELRRCGFEKVQLHRLADTGDGHLRLRFSATPPPPEPAPSLLPLESIGDQIGGIAAGVDASGIDLLDLERTEQEAHQAGVSLRIQGTYPEVYDWLQRLSYNPSRRGLRHASLRRDEPREIEAHLQMVVHSPLPGAP